MRALVAGGAGFVGSHVADALSDAGHEVTVLDQGPAPWLREGQRLVEADIRDLDAVSAACEGQEAVYNFAGLADIDEARRRPLDTAAVNVVGNVTLLEAARRAGAGRYLFASTIYVSSEAGSFYRVSKQACELYVEEYGREHGLPYTILRYGTLYGRRCGESNSVRRYLRQALEQRRIEATGTGQELREYVHVADAARLSVEVLGDEFENEQVVLTGDHPMRFGDLLALIREIVGEDVEIDLREPDPAAESSPHYSITPYTFRPKVARKLSSRLTHDLGQGLVDCLHELSEAGSEREAAR